MLVLFTVYCEAVFRVLVVKPPLEVLSGGAINIELERT